MQIKHSCDCKPLKKNASTVLEFNVGIGTIGGDASRAGIRYRKDRRDNWVQTPHGTDENPEVGMVVSFPSDWRWQ